MTVSWRHMLVAGAACAALAGGLTAIGQSAPGCCAPPVYTPPPAPRAGCCAPPPNLVVNVPGVSVAASSVSVGASTTAVAAAGVSTRLSSGVVVSGSSGAQITTIMSGGGSAGFSGYAGGSSGVIQGFQAQGGTTTRIVEEDVSIVEEYCIDRIVEEMSVRPVQAVCIDDTNNPHPASRVDDDVSVVRGHRGEVYRCMSGTHLQVTLGAMDGGNASFASGESFSCLKGEALWHEPGGKLTCRPQAPERNCNERSLLRRHGPGVKLIEVATPKTYCEPATRERLTKVAKQVSVPLASVSGDLVLDGGVGGW